jgi:hypothetical protein
MSTHGVHFRLTLSARDLTDLGLVIEASLSCDRVLRDLSDDETRRLGVRLSSPLAHGTFGGIVTVDERDLDAIANITMALDIQGVGDFPALRAAGITDRRLDELCDMVWQHIGPPSKGTGDRNVLRVWDDRSHSKNEDSGMPLFATHDPDASESSNDRPGPSER